jgi:hypothetical protein
MIIIDKQMIIKIIKLKVEIIPYLTRMRFPAQTEREGSPLLPMTP